MPHTLDVSSLRMKPGDHVCAFYPGLADRDEILNLYLREGLAKGDKCLCIVDSTGMESVLVTLGSDIDLESILARRQLDVRESAESYLRGGGFSTNGMIDFWDAVIGEALDGEYRFARAVGEMTWALRQMPGVEQLVAYESRLNKFLPRYPQMILCLYELSRFAGKELADVLKVHPKVLLAGIVLDNPYYIEPDEFLAS